MKSTAVDLNRARGRVLVLPGVFNTRFHLARFARSIEQRGFDVEVWLWGARFVRFATSPRMSATSEPPCNLR